MTNSSPRFSAATTVGYLTAYNERTRRVYVGLRTSDGRCRVDLVAGESLSDLTFWETTWTDPENPWAGGQPTRQVPSLRPDYT